MNVGGQAFLFEPLLSVLLSINLGVALLGFVVILCFNFVFTLTLHGAVIFGIGPARLPSYCWIDWTCDYDSLSRVPLTQGWLPSREHTWKKYLQSISGS